MNEQEQSNADGPRLGRVGLVGLGNMGSALARRLCGAFDVVAFDPHPSPAATRLVDDGAVELAADVLDLASAPIVLLSLPAPEISYGVITALVAKMAPGSTIVETSTVTPMDLTRCREACEPAGIALVDAAILSGVAQTYDGVATLLVGGKPADVERVSAPLRAFASRIEHLGPSGAGMAAKVINNAVAHTTMVVLAEAGALAAQAGISLHRLGELLGDSEGGLVRPLTHRFMERVLNGEYDGGMSTENARKDSSLALRLAGASSVPLFAIHATHTVYDLAVSNGLGSNDYASIATLWEGWVPCDLRES